MTPSMTLKEALDFVEIEILNPFSESALYEDYRDYYCKEHNVERDEFNRLYFEATEAVVAACRRYANLREALLSLVEAEERPSGAGYTDGVMRALGRARAALAEDEPSSFDRERYPPFVIRCWIETTVAPSDDCVYTTRERALADLNHLRTLQPENIYDLAHTDKPLDAYGKVDGGRRPTSAGA